MAEDPEPNEQPEQENKGELAEDQLGNVAGGLVNPGAEAGDPSLSGYK